MWLEEKNFVSLFCEQISISVIKPFFMWQLPGRKKSQLFLNNKTIMLNLAFVVTSLPCYFNIIRWIGQHQTQANEELKEINIIVSWKWIKLKSVNISASVHIHIAYTKGTLHKPMVKIVHKRGWLHLLVNSQHCEFLMHSKRHFSDMLQERHWSVLCMDKGYGYSITMQEVQ